MSIENKLNNIKLDDIIAYFSKDGFNVNYDKYKFVLTDEEVYIVSEFIKSISEKTEFNTSKIADDLMYDAHLTKERTNETIVARLLIVAYKKMKHVDNYYTSDEQFKNTTLKDALYLDIDLGDSITLENYIRLSNEGYLYASTSRLERFLLKYRIGMMADYKKLKLDNQMDNDYYQDVATFCYELGYSNKRLSTYTIKNMFESLNLKLLEVYKTVEINDEINDIDLAIAFMSDRLKFLNTRFKENNRIDNYELIMREVKEKMAYVNTKFKVFFKEQVVNENEKENISDKRL